VALLARCFCAWAGLLSQEVSAMEDTQWANQPDTAALLDSYRPFAGILTSGHALAMMAYVDMFPRYLEMAGLSSDVQQQLEQQVAAASDKVAGLQGAVLLAASRAWPSNERPYAGLAAQQLSSMAQAVAGSIARSTACNTPSSCSNLAQRSELVLVGGKSCVCARGKVTSSGGLCAAALAALRLVTCAYAAASKAVLCVCGTVSQQHGRITWFIVDCGCCCCLCPNACHAFHGVDRRLHRCDVMSMACGQQHSQTRAAQTPLSYLW
jgi:hypothetical protein